MNTAKKIFFEYQMPFKQVRSFDPVLQRLRDSAEPYSSIAYDVHEGEKRDDGTDYSSHLEEVVLVLNDMLYLDKLKSWQQRIILGSHWLHDSLESFFKKNEPPDGLFSRIYRADDDWSVKKNIIEAIIYNTNFDNERISLFLKGMLDYPDKFQQVNLVAGKNADIWHNSQTMRKFISPEKNMLRVNKNEDYISFLEMSRQFLFNHDLSYAVNFDKTNFYVDDAIAKRKMIIDEYTIQQIEHNYQQLAN